MEEKQSLNAPAQLIKCETETTYGTANVIKLDVTKIKMLEDKMKVILDTLTPYEAVSANFSFRFNVMIEVHRKDSDVNRKIMLVHNKMSKPRIPQYSKNIIFEQLKYHLSLIKIDFSNNDINNSDILKLSEAMIHHKNIQSIDLINNSISLQGAKALAVALIYCNSLIHLNLYGNSIPNAGMYFLGKSMRNSKSLERIDIRNNAYSLYRVKPLLTLTRFNQKLREFQYI